MPITLTMPALSPTMEEGTLNKWLIKEGDTIAAGDIIAEIETDKATMEYEAVDDGRIARILVSDGQEAIPVNAPIAVVLEDGEDESALDAYVPEAGNAPPPAAAEAQPVAPQAAAPQENSAPAPAPAPTPTLAHAGARIFASPLARRMAAQEGLDPALLTGSGPNGRIVKRDVEAALAAGTGKAAAAAPKPASAAAAVSVETMFPDGSYETVAHTPMRKTIARRLTESKSTIPHFYLTIECNLDALIALRKELNARAGESDGAPDYKISVNDFIIRASALALRKVPEANASWTDAAILRHAHADVGVAVAIEGGLITPIVWQAETKGLAQISNEMQDLATRARDRKLKPQEYEGGTFSISNLGMFGIKEFSAVINPPHSMIMAIGAGEQRPVVRDGALAIATMMDCTLSCDHRVVDGTLGAEFLNVFKGFIEDPVTMLL